MSELLNAALRCKDRADELAAATVPVPPRALTAFQQRINAARLTDESHEQRDRRADLAAWFLSHGETYRFPVDGEMVSGTTCAEHLKEGREFRVYFQLQGQGEYQRRNRPDFV